MLPVCYLGYTAMSMQPPYKPPKTHGDIFQGVLLAAIKTPTGPAWENYTDDVAQELGYSCGYAEDPAFPKITFLAKDVSIKSHLAYSPRVLGQKIDDKFELIIISCVLFI